MIEQVFLSDCSQLFNICEYFKQPEALLTYTPYIIFHVASHLPAVNAHNF